MRFHSGLIERAVLITAVVALAACRDESTPTSLVRREQPLGTLSSGQTTTALGRSTVGPFNVQSDFDGHRVELKSLHPSDILVNSSSLGVGGQTGWHTHSGPVLVVVTSGAFTFYEGADHSCTPRVYPAGTAFVETGGLKDVHIGRNEGSVPVTWIATAILPVGVAGRVDVPAPGNCAF